MALEDLTGTKYLDSLVITNPAFDDVRSEGDDHIRGIKNVVTKSFPNVAGAVTKTHTQLNNMMEIGGDVSTLTNDSDFQTATQVDTDVSAHNSAQYNHKSSNGTLTEADFTFTGFIPGSEPEVSIEWSIGYDLIVTLAITSATAGVSNSGGFSFGDLPVALRPSVTVYTSAAGFITYFDPVPNDDSGYLVINNSGVVICRLGGGVLHTWTIFGDKGFAPGAVFRYRLI